MCIGSSADRLRIAWYPRKWGYLEPSVAFTGQVHRQPELMLVVSPRSFDIT